VKAPVVQLTQVTRQLVFVVNTPGPHDRGSCLT
jgi:hypothetical protein